jgi:hypothetical protein
MFRTTWTPEAGPPVLHCTCTAEALPQVMRLVPPAGRESRVWVTGFAGSGRGPGAARRYRTSNSPRHPFPAQIRVSRYPQLDPWRQSEKKLLFTSHALSTTPFALHSSRRDLRVPQPMRRVTGSEAVR